MRAGGDTSAAQGTKISWQEWAASLRSSRRTIKVGKTFMDNKAANSDQQAAKQCPVCAWEDREVMDDSCATNGKVKERAQWQW